MSGIIKKYYPQSRVLFLGRTYTAEIIALSKNVDEFINYDELEKLPVSEQVEKLSKYKADIFLHVFPQKNIASLAKKAGIPLRVGTTNRAYHWLTCNELVRLSRKNSPFHEAQLNIKLLRFLNILELPALSEIAFFYGLKNPSAPPDKFQALIQPSKFNLILHPKSKGSAREWGLANFKQLADLLPEDKFEIFISGISEDRNQMIEFLSSLDAKKNVHDLTGKMSLKDFIGFIYQCDGLVAASTGPLHISAALGKRAVGLFSSRRPIHPGRWRPLGEKAQVLVFDPLCARCASKKDCDCVSKISPDAVKELLIK